MIRAVVLGFVLGFGLALVVLCAALAVNDPVTTPFRRPTDHGW